MPNDAFEQFREMVLSDDALQNALVPILDREEFIARVIELGQLHSFEFESEDVVQAMRDARATLSARWK